MRKRYKIGVVGAGYVGLTTAACFSELGHKVICYDKDEEKIKKLKEGIVPIWEPGLDELIKKNIGKNLFFTSSPDEIYPESEVIFICVGTPQSQDGSPDMSYVELCSIEISKYLDENNYKIIVEKSTVPVKTADWIKRTISLYNPQAKFDIVSNPEFLREGSAIHDFFYPDRVVIGTESERAKEVMLDIYNDEEFKCPKVMTDVKTAEVIKHASNSFLALKISYINMIADFCEKVGVDVEAVAEGMGLDKRIGRAFLKAGVGWGGSCFPKDIKAFIKMAKDNQISFSILEEAYKVNEARIDVFIKKIKDALWVIKGKKIAVWGLSFKPNTDDIREAPALKIIPRLLNEGALLQLYDPKAMENAKKVIPPSDQVFYASSAYAAAKGAHAIAIITEWDEFKNVNLQEIKKLMITPIIVDGRNIFEPKKVRELGFLYFSMGRP
ncbi:MAG: UDP-glucose/GDP-mannose dehydrogenase family protein [Candidatus Calescibacterium sp.]|jgi:UDPglucose 6-dehydrogenase|nr:UDP-glucose/GDP-mannose dehydrogenase family protein [Candidatus Calescibacterium sp.]